MAVIDYGKAVSLPDMEDEKHVFLGWKNIIHGDDETIIFLQIPMKGF